MPPSRSSRYRSPACAPRPSLGLQSSHAANSQAVDLAALDTYLDHYRLLVVEALELARLADWEASALRLRVSERTSAATSIPSAARELVYELGRNVDIVKGFSSVQSTSDVPMRNALNLLIDTASGRRQWQTLERLAEHRL